MQINFHSLVRITKGGKNWNMKEFFFSLKDKRLPLYELLNVESVSRVKMNFFISVVIFMKGVNFHLFFPCYVEPYLMMTLPLMREHALKVLLCNQEENNGILVLSLLFQAFTHRSS